MMIIPMLLFSRRIKTDKNLSSVINKRLTCICSGFVANDQIISGFGKGLLILMRTHNVSVKYAPYVL